ncbi:MAG: PQQ-binding-like beta-propeller repeat protein [Spirochaetota bacterium]
MRKIIILLLYLLITACLCQCCFALARENWPTYMGNRYLTGNNDGLVPRGDEIYWKFRSAGILYNPVCVEDRVYVVSTDHYLYCLDARDGSVRWKFKSEGPLTRMVVVYKDRVFLPSGRYLYCLDAESGHIIWARRDRSYGFYGTPTIASGKIFYGNRKGFYARELSNGHLIWKNMDIYTYRGFPSYWEGLVFTVSREFEQEISRLTALREKDGTEAWSRVLPNVPNIYSPLVLDDTVYLACGSRLAVFNAQNGEKRYEKTFASPVSSNPVYSQGSIFLSLADGSILKIKPDTGDYTTLCRLPMGTGFAAVKNYLFIPVKSRPGGLMVVNAETGNQVRRIAIEESEPGTITLGSGMAFLSSKYTLLAIGRGGGLFEQEKIAEKTAPEKKQEKEAPPEEKAPEKKPDEAPAEEQEAPPQEEPQPEPSGPPKPEVEAGPEKQEVPEEEIPGEEPAGAEIAEGPKPGKEKPEEKPPSEITPEKETPGGEEQEVKTTKKQKSREEPLEKQKPLGEAPEKAEAPAETGPAEPEPQQEYTFKESTYPSEEGQDDLSTMPLER